MQTIKMTMPDEMAKEFWTWWIDGGGEDTMYECVGYTFDHELQVGWNSLELTMHYINMPEQLELDL